jgi:hypothetical protein
MVIASAVRPYIAAAAAIDFRADISSAAVSESGL